MQAELSRLGFGQLSFELETLRLGAGKPLLFLHGIDGVEGARALLDLLAEHFEVHAPSHPGFGASSRPPDIDTTGDLAYFYLDYLDRLGLNDITLVGASLGSWLACEILIRDASRFVRAILSAPLGLLQTEDKRNVLTDIFSMPASAWPNMFCAKGDNFISPGPGTGSQNLRIARNREAAALYGWSPYMANPKLAQRLHRIRIPTLVVQGSKDSIAPQEYGSAFAQAIPGAHRDVAEGCGHLVHADDPKGLAQTILAFAETESR